MVWSLWKAVLQKIKNRITAAIPLWVYIPKRIKGRILKRYLHAHVHNSIIHNSQVVEVTQVSVGG